MWYIEEPGPSNLFSIVRYINIVKVLACPTILTLGVAVKLSLKTEDETGRFEVCSMAPAWAGYFTVGFWSDWLLNGRVSFGLAI